MYARWVEEARKKVEARPARFSNVAEAALAQASRIHARQTASGERRSASAHVPSAQAAVTRAQSEAESHCESSSVS